MDAVDSHVVEADGLRLHVTSYGGPPTTPPLMLMHGGMAHGAWCAPLARELRSDFRPFALDRRGHGKSDWADVAHYGWAEDLADAERVSAELDDGPWVLVGHSQGGLLSVHLALRAKIPLRALVVLDSPFQPRAPALVRAGKSFRRMPQLRYPSMAVAVRRFQPYPTPHVVPDDILSEIAHESFKPSGDGGFVSRFHWERFQAVDGSTHPLHSFPEDVGRVPVPTLVVRGGESTILSADDHAAFVERLPQGRGVEIPEVTHSLHVERPGDVAAEIAAFVAAL
ncbi:MAG: alpha/beta hydrolase [Candidatus Binatia bacterium]|nr:alpha/beta hydrolase [Candidatus Binatia bacterium]